MIIISEYSMVFCDEFPRVVDFVYKACQHVH